MKCTDYTKILFQNNEEEITLETFAKHCLKAFIKNENFDPTEEKLLENFDGGSFYR